MYQTYAMDSNQVRDYLMSLQRTIMSAVSTLDGGTSFVSDEWQKPLNEPLQGNGITQILEDGKVFERAGCGFSHVKGHKLPPSATQHRPDLAGMPFEAMGVSLVFHPRNPYVPTVHMNVRMISVTTQNDEPVSWFGGGMDLTPYYGFEEDAVHFHKICHDTLAPYGRACIRALRVGVMTISVSSIEMNKEVLEAFSLMISQNLESIKVSPCSRVLETLS